MSRINDWLTKLSAHHLIPSEAQLPDSNSKLPWYLRVLSGFCGWLAAWFLVGFTEVTFPMFEHSGAMGFVGILLIGGAFVAFQRKGNDFVEQMGLAISIAGQLFICLALLSDGAFDEVSPWLILTALQVLLAIVMPNYLHRLLCAYFATVALAMAMGILQIATFFSAILLLLATLIWLNEFTFTRRVSAFQAIGYGITIGLIQFKTSMLFRHTKTWAQEGLPTVNAWLDEGLNTFVLLFALFLMLRRRKLVFAQRDKWVAGLLLLLVLVANVFANGIVVGVAILLIGYATQNRALSVLGVVAMMIHLSSYYYLLDLSLLSKSFVMMATGASCLLIGLVWHKQSATGTVGEN